MYQREVTSTEVKSLARALLTQASKGTLAFVRKESVRFEMDALKSVEDSVVTAVEVNQEGST